MIVIKSVFSPCIPGTDVPPKKRRLVSLHQGPQAIDDQSLKPVAAQIQDLFERSGTVYISLDIDPQTIRFKDDPRWTEQYHAVKQELATREHITRRQGTS